MYRCVLYRLYLSVELTYMRLRFAGIGRLRGHSIDTGETRLTRNLRVFWRTMNLRLCFLLSLGAEPVCWVGTIGKLIFTLLGHRQPPYGTSYD